VYTQKKTPKAIRKGPERIWVPKDIIILIADMLYGNRLGIILVPGQ